MEKTILVTGGAGFIGTNFIYYILNERPDWRVVCVDSLTYAGNADNLGKAQENPLFAFYKEDIRNKNGILVIFEKERPDYVVNFAAESHVDRSIDDPTIFIDTNVNGTMTLLEACRKYPVERFHQISTDEVYGDLPLDRPDLKFTEESLLRPSSPYSVSKASADLLALSYFRTYKVPVTISRCSNNYGPYQHNEKLIPRMIDKARKNAPLPVFGSGLNVRDWIYVTDHCRGVLSVLEKGENGEVYNFGGHCEKTNLEIIRFILSELNRPEELISFIADRPGHDRRYAVNTVKAEKELGWKPVFGFESSLKNTIDWYLTNSD